MYSKIEKFLSKYKNSLAAFFAICSACFTAGMFYDVWKTSMKNMPKEVVAEMIKQLNDVDKKLDLHVTADKYEKEIISSKIAELKLQLNDLKNEINTYKGAGEFIRPTEPAIERKGANKKAPE